MTVSSDVTSALEFSATRFLNAILAASVSLFNVIFFVPQRVDESCHSLARVKGRGSAKAPLTCGRGSPQPVCLLRGGCETCEEDSVEDKEGVHVLGEVK